MVAATLELRSHLKLTEPVSELLPRPTPTLTIAAIMDSHTKPTPYPFHITNSSSNLSLTWNCSPSLMPTGWFEKLFVLSSFRPATLTIWLSHLSNGLLPEYSSRVAKGSRKAWFYVEPMCIRGCTRTGNSNFFRMQSTEKHKVVACTSYSFLTLCIRTMWLANTRKLCLCVLLHGCVHKVTYIDAVCQQKLQQCMCKPAYILTAATLKSTKHRTSPLSA